MATASSACGSAAEEGAGYIVGAEEAAHFTYKPFLIAYVMVGCSECVVGCPHDAIVLGSDGICSVDPEKCVGQKFRVNTNEYETSSEGLEVYRRIDEDQCWECFAGNEEYSEKCPRGVLRKALHHNGVCCASCPTKSRALGLSLMELCPEEPKAITVESGSFVVDKDKCTGCMRCYNNINCYLTDGSNYTIRMVAYSDPDRMY